MPAGQSFALGGLLCYRSAAACAELLVVYESFLGSFLFAGLVQQPLHHFWEFSIPDTHILSVSY